MAQQTNYFINPPSAGPGEFFLDNPVLAIDEQVELKWLTDLEWYSIGLWQQSLGVGVATRGPSKIPGGPEEGAINWTVGILGFSLGQSDVFYFNLSGELDQEPIFFTSHYFNLTATAAVNTVSSTNTITSASTMRTSSQPNPTADSPSNSSSTRSDNDPISEVGLGVGLGLGIPLLALVGYLFFQRKKRVSGNDISLSVVEARLKQKPTSAKSQIWCKNYRRQRGNQECGLQNNIHTGIITAVNRRSSMLHGSAIEEEQNQQNQHANRKDQR